MIKQTKRLSVFLVLLITPYLHISIFGQGIETQVLDSLQGMSYEKLKASYTENTQNIAIAELYANAYLSKAKQERDTTHIIKGFRFLSRVAVSTEIELSFIDSIIFISRHGYGKKYPGLAYLIKGSVLHDKHNYKGAMLYYSKTIEYAEKYSNDELLYGAKYDIGILKSKIGEYNQALSLFFESYQYYNKKKSIKKDSHDHLMVLFALSDTYKRINILDSASFFNKLGYKEAIIFKDSIMQTYFSLNEGAIQCDKGNYIAVVDSIMPTIERLKSYNDSSNISIAFFFLGKSFLKLKEEEKSLFYLLKMDSIIQKNMYLIPEEREGYELLLDYYKDKKNYVKQLYFTQRLLKVDSILSVNYKEISKELVLKYDTPILIKEKEAIIGSLNQSKASLSSKLKWFLSLLILAVFLMSFFFYRQRLYKNNFEVISDELKENKKLINKKFKRKSGKRLSKEQVEIIMKKIDNFEKELGFLEKNITLQLLSVRLKTNSSYLSKVFNQHKNQKLADYLNELRISYALEVLPKDNKLQQYTIKALASEFGYNTAESFSKAFYKRTSVYPSFYIKELTKDNEIRN